MVTLLSLYKVLTPVVRSRLEGEKQVEQFVYTKCPKKKWYGMVATWSINISMRFQHPGIKVPRAFGQCGASHGVISLAWSFTNIIGFISPWPIAHKLQMHFYHGICVPSTYHLGPWLYET